MKIIPLIPVIILVFSNQLISQNPINQDDLNRIASESVSKFGLPGVAIGYHSYGSSPVYAVVGFHSIDSVNRVTKTSVFHIGSVTKSFTALIAAKALSDAGLSLDTELSKTFTEYPIDPAYRTATIREVMGHLAGFPSHLLLSPEELDSLNQLPGSPVDQRGTYVASMLKAGPVNPGFQYSNAGYAVVAHAAELLTGESWESLVESFITQPLGLSSVSLGWPFQNGDEQPKGHYIVGDSLVKQKERDFEVGAFLNPAGNLSGNVIDLTAFGIAHLHGLLGMDGHFSSEMILDLHTPSGDVPYAAGWGIDPVSGQHRHRGSLGTYFSYIVVDPADKVVFTFLTNVGPPRGMPASKYASDVLYKIIKGE